MVAKGRPTMQEMLRLDAIATHLGIATRYGDDSFFEEATEASLTLLEPILSPQSLQTGEEVVERLARHFSVKFEEVYGPQDVINLETKYLKRQKELGFAQLRQEISNPEVDALLFRRMHASEGEPDRWVAVLNLQNSNAKSYWNKNHELTHRFGEPQQRMLPFRRHRNETTSPVERLIDHIAADVAFYPPVFRPLVIKAAKKSRLSLNTAEGVRMQYAPSSSVLSSLKAVVKHWPTAAVVISACLRGRLSDPKSDRALRVTLQGWSKKAPAAGLNFFRNMRVPRTSPVYEAYAQYDCAEGSERLSSWTTSTGDALEAVDVYTSARRFGDTVYAVLCQ